MTSSKVRQTKADKIAKEAGFAVWEMGGGCQAYAVELMSGEMDDGQKANMDLMVTANEGDNVAAYPSDLAWTATVNFEDPTRNDTILMSESELTLKEAIAVALDFAKGADELWRNEFDPSKTATPSP